MDQAPWALLFISSPGELALLRFLPSATPRHLDGVYTATGSIMFKSTLGALWEALQARVSQSEILGDWRQNNLISFPPKGLILAGLPPRTSIKMYARGD